MFWTEWYKVIILELEWLYADDWAFFAMLVLFIEQPRHEQKTDTMKGDSDMQFFENQGYIYVVDTTILYLWMCTCEWGQSMREEWYNLKMCNKESYEP